MMPSLHPGSSVTWTLVMLVGVTCIRPCVGQTNNSVNDADGSIVWGELAPDKAYKTADYVADDGGLDPYYALAVSFIDSSLPELLPVATVKDILDGNASIGDKWQELAGDFVGYAVCVVLGLLFFLIFPIVACCFCCCRCCGNCGGKRIHHQGPNDRCKRITFGIILAILSLFVLAGAACVFVTSDQVHKNLDGLNKSSSDAVEDLNTFVDNIDNQFRRLGDTNFQFLTDTVADYVAGASSELADDIIKAISDEVNLDGPLDQISTLRSSAIADLDVLNGQVVTLDNQRQMAATNLAACPACVNHLNGAMVTELADLKTEIETFKDQVSTDVLGDLKTELDTAIETEVTDTTSNIDVAAELDKIHADQIKGMLDKMSEFKTNLNKDASKFQEFAEDFVELTKPYDTYRWYAGVGLASLLGLLAVMMLIGVLLGTCCSSAHDRPTERSAASNCGGICLMAAVGLVFIFGALLMLLCTLMYMLGSPTERYACQSIDHLDRVEKYAKSFDLGIDPSNYTITLNGETISVSVSSVMTDCKEKKTLYTALGLKSVVDTALNEIESYKNELDDINNIDAGEAANSTKNSVNADQAIADLEDTVNSIDTVKQSIVDLRNELQTQQGIANGLQSGSGVHYDPMITTLGYMETTCAKLKTTAQSMKAAATDLKVNQLSDAIAMLDDKAFMTSLITNVTEDFVETIFGFVDSYTEDIKTKLENDVAKCTPFYSIINAMLGEAVCHGIVDPLNGFWLALGWCLFFFMPSLILAVKLAKHYRTMLYEDSYDATTDARTPPPYYTEASAPPKTTLFPPISGPNNKVAPF